MKKKKESIWYGLFMVGNMRAKKEKKELNLVFFSRRRLRPEFGWLIFLLCIPVIYGSFWIECS
ncbi:hypothetical protein D1823_13820 [Ruegeria sp. AD91A]|nr:hypothetical protein D1823_13820 [Ruegeria sp. AD91A]